MKELRWTVSETDEGRKIETILASRLLLSPSRIRSLKFSGGILLDGIPTRAVERVRIGQTVSAVLCGDAQTSRESPLIVYEDDDFFVVNKPAPLPTAGALSREGDTLERRILPLFPPGFLFRPVSRLDKGTSGLMLCAKDTRAHALAQGMLHTDALCRRYLALVEGAPRDRAGVIDFPILEPESGVRRTVSGAGRPAVTRYEVLKEYGARSLLRLTLETGRTHQIRVHLKAIGCPVTGDALYGSPEPSLPNRFALHSWALDFTNPLTGARVKLRSPLPPECRALIERKHPI